MVQFVPGKGLVEAVHGEEIVIFEYNLKVTAVKKYISYKSREIERTEYTVEICDKGGKKLGDRAVANLKKLDIFDWWDVPDAQLSADDRKLIYQKLQYDVESVKKKGEAYEIVTIIEKGFHESLKLFALGDKIIGNTGKMKAEIKDPLPLKDISRWKNAYNSDEYKKYMLLWPEVTVPLFYAAMMPVIKQLVPQQWKPFIKVLQGPPGHLKTTLVSIYCLFLKDESMQISTVRGNMHIHSICKKLDELKGLGFLLDDVHPTSTYQSREQQMDRLDVVVRHITTNTDTAEVFVTAENMKALGSYSSSDRMCILEVPRISSERMAGIKSQLKTLNTGQMTFFAVLLADELLKDWNKAKEFAVEYLKKDDILPFETENISRVPYYMKQFLLTEELCRKYVFSENAELSCRTILERVLEKNYYSQMEYLNKLGTEEKHLDYAFIVCELVMDELNKSHCSQSTMICMSEDEYWEAEGPKFLLKRDRGGKSLLITREHLQIMLAKKVRRTINMKALTHDLREKGILQTYASGESTIKVGRRGTRCLCISLTILMMYEELQKRL